MKTPEEQIREIIENHKLTSFYPYPSRHISLITEINLPTDEEINALFPMHENPRPYQKQTTTMKRNAAKKIIKQIEKQ